MKKRILETIRPVESQGAENVAVESQDARNVAADSQPAAAKGIQSAGTIDSQPAASEPPVVVYEPLATVVSEPTDADPQPKDKVLYKGSTSRKPYADEHQSMAPMNPAELLIYWSNLVKEVDITKKGLVEAREKRSKEGDGNKKGNKKGGKK
ncbi:hypothetical protein RIF29_38534 [Crotalaria pallida]|uniref:Uncharacterized protein n=1 Tax=Crotalaria pallida TaxID=3830 RepID=A0AAN9DZE9_CROPI